MRIAVPYEDGNVFQHFGHTGTFKLYEIQDGKIAWSMPLNPDGAGHEALADFLSRANVSAVICGGLGGGAQRALMEAGIAFYPGVVGEADAAALAFAQGKLLYNPNGSCPHHDHAHGEGHDCGSCGMHGAEGAEGCEGCGMHCEKE